MSLVLPTFQLELEKQKVFRLELSLKEHQKSIHQFQRGERCQLYISITRDAKSCDHVMVHCLLRCVAVSLLAIKEHDELQEKFETERKLKNAIVVEAQRVSHFSSHNLFSHQKQPKKSPPHPPNESYAHSLMSNV